MRDESAEKRPSLRDENDGKCPSLRDFLYHVYFYCGEFIFLVFL